MPINFTSEQIMAMAPDPSSAQAGRGLANLRTWERLGQHEYAIWGECKGSGKEPYRVQVDLREPAFRCSCPSRKFPCKHGIALLLLSAQHNSAFSNSEPPPWVVEWLAKRDQQSQKRSDSAAPTAAPASKRSTSGKTQQARETKVAAGLAELRQWLRDQVRQGLTVAQSRSPAAWDGMAARMVDAQAPGVARLIRQLAALPASGEGWQGRMLQGLARIHLLIEGYQRADQLPAPLLAEVRTQIGWPQDQDLLRQQAGVTDRWIVVGQRMEEQDQLRVLRTWLWGEQHQQPALILAFAAPGQPLDRSVVVGTQFEAELVYFEGCFPLRALIKQRHHPPTTSQATPGYPTLAAGFAAYGAALALNPWIEHFPLPLQAGIPRMLDGRWIVVDQQNHTVPLVVSETHGWQLLAQSGGRPIWMFGEWDGDKWWISSGNS